MPRNRTTFTPNDGCAAAAGRKNSNHPWRQSAAAGSIKAAVLSAKRNKAKRKEKSQ